MKRVLSAAVLLPLVLIVFISGNTYVVDVFMGIVALRCIYELFHAFEQKGHHPVRWVGYLAAIAIMFIHVIPEHYSNICFNLVHISTYEKDENRCNRYSNHILWSMLHCIIFNVYVNN